MNMYKSKYLGPFTCLKWETMRDREREWKRQLSSTGSFKENQILGL